MKVGLDLLYALQQKDDELKEIENIIQDIPLAIKKLEAERDAKSEMVAKAKERLNVNLEERKKFEREILAVKDKIAKYKEQMKKVTTNKEYQGFIAEIKYEEGTISQIEEKIIEKMVEFDEIMEIIRQTEADFKKIAEDYNIKIADLQQTHAYQKQKLLDETARRSELQARVEPPLYKVYEQLYKKKGGKVVAKVQTDFCGVCNIKIRPQVLSELIISSDLMVCENCGRILFKQIVGDEETE